MPSLRRALQCMVFVCFLSIPFSSAFPQSTSTFVSGINSSAGASPQSLAVGDFNHDGKMDVVTENFSGNTVSILLGDGDGTFQGPINYPVGSGPSAIIVGDFNGDGILDLAVTNENANTLSILLGNGDGTFRTAVNYAVGTSPVSVVAADFNGDGVLDLAVVNISSQNISILLGNGNGTFQNAVGYGAGSNPIGIAAADLNGDGNLDLVVGAVGTGNVSVLLGNGNGTFQAATQFAAGSSPRSVVVADLNGDGKPDLAVANQTNTMSVLMGNGDGTFQSPLTYAAGDTPVWIQAINLAGSALPDLAIVNTNSNDISVFRNNGDGTFRTAQNYVVGLTPSQVSAADVDGDGKQDVVTVDTNSNEVTVLLGNGDGTLQGARNFPTQGRLQPALGDFNADGKLDLSISDEVHLGNGDGTFQTGQGASSQDSVAIADLNGDGKLDQVVAHFSANTIGVQLGNGDGTFQSEVTYPAEHGPQWVAIGDFNGDGKPDIVTANIFTDTVSIFLGNGDGTFQSKMSYAADSAPSFVATGDFNGDGKLDLAVVDESGNDVSILLGNGDGTFQPAVNYNVGSNPFTLAVGDFNKDGKLDLAVANGRSNTVSILLGNGDGTFQASVNVPVTEQPFGVAALDFDGDGNLDLAVTNRGNHQYISILKGSGDGTFQPPINFDAGQNPLGIATGDVNGDGAPDVIAVNSNSFNFTVLLNARGTLINVQSSLNPSQFGQSVTLTATVSSSIAKNRLPSGAVSLYDGSILLGSAPLAGGVASLTISTLTVGTHSITPVYSGDTNFNPHSGQGFLQVITATLAPTQTMLASSLNPSSAGQSVTFTATVSAGASPTGSVAFNDGSTTLATVALTGIHASYTTLSLTTGTHAMTATYSGDSGNTSSSSAILYQNVLAVPPGAVLLGVVADRNTGLPLVGVGVIVGCSSCAPTTFTDGNGQYSLTAAQVSNQSNGVLTFQGHGYFANQVNYTITGTPTVLDATLLPGGTLIQGTISDANTHLPIAGAQVGVSNKTQTVNGLSTTSDSSGNYAIDSSSVFESVASGFASQGLGATASGYFNYVGPSFQVVPPYPVVMNAAMIPASGIVLQGTVRDRSTSAPLPGVNVIVGCGSCGVQTVTDGNGQYSLTAAQVSNQSSGALTFQGHGYFANQVNYTITGTPTVLDATLLPGGTLIQGTISDANTHLPIAGAQVGVSNKTQTVNGLSTTSDSSGNYAIDSSSVFESVASGFASQGLGATASGYFNYVGPSFQVVPPYPVVMNAAMIPASGIVLQGTVRDRSTSAPLPGVNVIVGCGSCGVQTVTDGNGQYSLTAAQVSNQSSGALTFQGHGYFANQVNYTITGTPTVLDATLLPGGTLIQGTISDANTHLPIAGAQVGVSNKTQTVNGLSTTSDSSGNYAIDSSSVFESVASGFASQGLSAVSSPGYFVFIGSPFAVQPPYPVIQNAQMTPTGVTVSVTVVTAPPNLQFTVDGTSYSSSAAFSWVPSNVHAVATATPQAGTPGTQYVFPTWSNGGPASQTIVVPIASTSYTANFATQYLLTTTTNPSAGGSVTAGGWLNAGASVAISATANSGFAFTGFTGDLSGNANPQTLVMTAPKSVIANFALAQVATSTSLTSSANSAVYGQPVSFTATVTSGSGTPTGTVSFYNGSTLIGSAILANGTATMSVKFSSVGSYALTATYGGDANHTSSTSSALIETINKASTTTSVTPSQNPQLVGQPITFTAIIASQFGGAASGSVTFKAGTTTLGTAAVSGNQAGLTTSFSTTGTRSITVLYGGDTNNTGSTSVALSQSVVAKFSATTTLTSSLNPSFVGQAVAFTATVTSPGGTPPNGETITFKKGTTTLATVPMTNGSASFTTSTLAAATNTIKASYAGDATFNASTSVGLNQVVNKYPTSTGLTSSLNPSIYGQAVTLTATVTSAGPNAPTGSVTFKNSSTSLATVTLSSGVATLTRTNLPAGTLSITATYNGDAESAASTSPALSQVINQATTITTIASSKNPSTFGQTVKFTATVSSPTVTPNGTATFFDGSTMLGSATLSGGKASFSTSTLSSGSHRVTAVYNGTANTAGSSSPVLTQVVN